MEKGLAVEIVAEIVDVGGTAVRAGHFHSCGGGEVEIEACAVAGNGYCAAADVRQAESAVLVDVCDSGADVGRLSEEVDDFARNKGEGLIAVVEASRVLAGVNGVDSVGHAWRCQGHGVGGFGEVGLEFEPVTFGLFSVFNSAGVELKHHVVGEGVVPVAVETTLCVLEGDVKVVGKCSGVGRIVDESDRTAV